MQPEPDLGTLESKFLKFDSLMQFRVKHVLLVSSLYDTFVLEEDGQLTDMIYREYLELNLTITPHVRRAANADEALRIIAEESIDLVIIFKRVADVDIVAFGRAAKAIHPEIPIVWLAYSEQELALTSAPELAAAVDRVFLWSGDVRLFLSVIKLIEDGRNVDHDTELIGVRVIVIVEDSVRFCSYYLPVLYTEIMQQTRALMAEGLNVTDKLLRMRARPKILLAQNYEEAWQLLTKYRLYLLGLISDFRFPRQGLMDDEGGPRLIENIRKEIPDLPIVMQSSDPSNAQAARVYNVGFVCKSSRTLNDDLRSFIREYFGFGDFVFRLPEGTELAVAPDFVSMEKCLEQVDERSIVYHANRNHFSNWLMARTEFDLAARLRPRRVEEFQDAAALRRYLINTFKTFRREKQRGVVSDFSRRQFDLQSDFARIGGGSIGGKGRGLAFINALLTRYDTRERFEGVHIAVPSSIIVGTDIFDAFMQKNDLAGVALGDYSDDLLAKLFLKASLPSDITNDLKAILDVVDYPLAVRSSSMLEDSHVQPFAGVFDTHMLVNGHRDKNVRLRQLETAIKAVYASTFFKRARMYHESLGNRPEEEKMAVIIQRAIGRKHGDAFYPSFAGVALSYNYYAVDGLKPDEGIAYVALGLGKTIVEGMNCLRFCPGHPDKLAQFATIDDLLANSQNEFFAIDLRDPGIFPEPGGEKGLIMLPAARAEIDGTLYPLCSTYSQDDDRIYPGCSRKGLRLITFAPILKSGLFPLAEIVQYLLRLGSLGLNCPVEVEFAVDMNDDPAGESEFAFLQIRPMAKEAPFETVSLGDVDSSRIIAQSEKTLGNFHDTEIRDLLLVRPDTFDRARTPEIAEQIDTFNRRFHAESRKYILIGPGRWGTRERWLGIPVGWDQISSARVIIETAYGDFCPEPSLGAHFFHSLTSFHVGYLTINPDRNNGFIDWQWLLSRPVLGETTFVRHIRLQRPAEIRLDGRTGRGMILK